MIKNKVSTSFKVDGLDQYAQTYSLLCCFEKQKLKIFEKKFSKDLQFINKASNNSASLYRINLPQAIYFFHMEQYETIKELGSGSFGRVIKARRKGTDGQYVAIKMIKMMSLSDKQKDSALNEIRLLASIHSPNVIAYHHAFFDNANATLCIVMEYADGGDLAGMIARKREKNQKFNQNFVWQVAHDLLKALKMLHGNKIIHRDLKPGNIFFVDGVAKLGDLNISKVMEGNFASTQAGTPYYTSPQIWNGQLYDGKCDIWSLGCLLYEIAALRPPFIANDFPSLSKRVNQGYFDPIPAIYSKRLSDVIKSCLKVIMRQRPSAAEILNDSVFQFMQSTEEGSVNLLNTIRCPKVLRMIQQKLPDSKSITKNKEYKEKEEHLFFKPPQSEILKKAASGEKYSLKSSIKQNQEYHNISKQRSKHSVREQAKTIETPTRGIIYRMQSPRTYQRPILTSPTVYRRIM